MVGFGQIIAGSIEWTATVLFRPFQIKKWFILGFIAFMAGYLGGEGNANYSSSRDYKKDKTEQAQFKQLSVNVTSPGVKENANSSKDIFRPFLKYLKNPQTVRIAIAIIAAILIISVIFLWLGSRFSFIFLQDVIKNDASIRVPFKENRFIGDSLFSFSMAFVFINILLGGLIIFMCLRSLFKLGVFAKASTVGFFKILLTCLPFALLLILLIIVAALVYLIVNDFVVVAMFKDKIKFTEAWPRVSKILLINKANFILYILIKWGLSIAVSLMYFIIYVVSLFSLLFPAAASVCFFYFIYRIIPAVFQIPYLVILFIAGVPLLFFLSYCLMCFCLPFAVFFRTFSVKFIGCLEPRYNLFRES